MVSGSFKAIKGIDKKSMIDFIYLFSHYYSKKPLVNNLSKIVPGYTRQQYAAVLAHFTLNTYKKGECYG